MSAGLSPEREAHLHASLAEAATSPASVTVELNEPDTESQEWSLDALAALFDDGAD